MAIGELTNLGFRRLGSTGVGVGEGQASGFRDIADDFAGLQRPKLKFNFTVHFKFRDTIKVPGANGDQFSGAVDYNNVGSAGMNEMVFALKQASRPNPTINYQPVNYYNFRTKVATSMDYGTMQLTLYDDVQNLAHSIFETYLKAVSPIANMHPDRIGSFDKDATGLRTAGFNSFNGSRPSGLTRDADGNLVIADGGKVESSASIGPLPDFFDGRLGLFESITIRQYYWNALSGSEAEILEEGFSSSKIEYVDYVYTNPKVVNMTLDELDMTQSEVSTVMMNFNYDSVYIQTPNREYGISPAIDNKDTRPYNNTVDREKLAIESQEQRELLVRTMNQGQRGRSTLSNPVRGVAPRPTTPQGPPRPPETDPVQDVRAGILNIQREIARIRRLDTIPDISAFEVADTIIPPTTNPLTSDALEALENTKAVVDTGVDAILDLPNIPDVLD